MAITVKHKFVSAIPDAGDTTIVQPSNWNDTHDLTGFGTSATLDAGVANGVATLDSSGTVPLSQIPALGDLNYQGTWNATTNSPTLTSSVGTKGFYYVVSVAGTTSLNGITDWQIGDWAVYNGSAWQKIDNTDAVTSVNGYTGTVVLTNTDISGFGTMSTQNANAVAITGGAIDGTAIGATTPKAITGTTITATTFSGSGASLTSIPNSALTNSAITINGTSTSLGGSISVGTVTSVTGTSPVVSSGGNTPAISMPAATTSVNGYLTSTDWNTFNGKSNTNGTVTSVAALTLGTTGTDLSSTVATGTTTPVITLNVPTASATNRGALSAADWTTFNNKQPAGTYINSVSGTTNQITASTTTGAVTLSLPTSITTGQYIANKNITTSANQGSFAYGTLGYSDINIYSSYTSSANAYTQKILQNTNAGAAASVDFIVSNDSGTASTYYGDFGITSSGYNTPGQNIINTPNTVYLQSVTTPLAIGTLNAYALSFYTNSTLAATISSAGLLTANSFASSSAAITGGSINNAIIGASTAAAITGTTITATKYVGVSGGTF